MSRIRDALERWREAERALAGAEPGSAEERRARAANDQARATYQRLIDEETVEGHQMPRRHHDSGSGGRRPGE